VGRRIRLKQPIVVVNLGSVCYGRESAGKSTKEHHVVWVGDVRWKRRLASDNTWATVSATPDRITTKDLRKSLQH
jgi:hypothetical protein